MIKRIGYPDPKNLELLKALLLEYDREHLSKWNGEQPTSEEEIERKTHLSLDQFLVLLHFPEQEEIPSGFLIAEILDLSIGYISHLYSKKRGGGRDLVQMVEGIYKAAGIVRIDCHVHQSNPSVIPFFEKMGYFLVSSNGAFRYSKKL